MEKNFKVYGIRNLVTGLYSVPLMFSIPFYASIIAVIYSLYKVYTGVFGSGGPVKPYLIVLLISTIVGTVALFLIHGFNLKRDEIYRTLWKAHYYEMGLSTITLPYNNEVKKLGIIKSRIKIKWIPRSLTIKSISYQGETGSIPTRTIEQLTLFLKGQLERYGRPDLGYVLDSDQLSQGRITLNLTDNVDDLEHENIKRKFLSLITEIDGRASDYSTISFKETPQYVFEARMESSISESRLKTITTSLEKTFNKTFDVSYSGGVLRAVEVDPKERRDQVNLTEYLYRAWIASVRKSNAHIFTRPEITLIKDGNETVFNLDFGTDVITEEDFDKISKYFKILLDRKMPKNYTIQNNTLDDGTVRVIIQ